MPTKKKAKRLGKKSVVGIIAGAVVVIAGIIAAAVLVNNGHKINAIIDYGDENQKATITIGEQNIEKIESGQGAVGDEVEAYKFDGQDIPTVESVDSDGPQVNPEDETPTECPEGEECGRGASFPYVDTSTPSAFVNATLGGCYNIDGYYDEQCWDYAALFFLNYAGHTFYTCGSGAAKGAIVDGCWQKNAGNEFTMIWDARQLQAGDIVVFNNGQFGHVGFATGSYNNGYITLAGQNQGGGLCPGSTMGARVNIINISLKYFAGAFRPNSYIKPEPTPEPEPQPEPTPTPTPAPVVDQCKVRSVKKGDTLGAIMKACRGKIEWGEAMNEYARHWVSTKLVPGQTVFYGWTHGTGYGLYAGDVIEYK